MLVKKLNKILSYIIIIIIVIGFTTYKAKMPIAFYCNLKYEYNSYKEKKQLVLIIDKIDIFEAIDFENTLDDGIEIHKQSSFEENGFIVLMSHSGFGENVIFNDLDKLDINDEVFLKYNNMIHNYIIIDKYLVNKRQEASIISNKNYLYLVTCDKKDKSKQLIMVAKRLNNAKF